MMFKPTGVDRFPMDTYRPGLYNTRNARDPFHQGGQPAMNVTWRPILVIDPNLINEKERRAAEGLHIFPDTVVESAAEMSPANPGKLLV